MDATKNFRIGLIMKSNFEMHNEMLKLSDLINDIKNIQHPADQGAIFYMNVQRNYLRKCIELNTVIDVENVNFGGAGSDIEFTKRYVEGCREWIMKTPKVESPSTIWKLMIAHGYIGPNKENFLQKAKAIS